MKNSGENGDLPGTGVFGDVTSFDVIDPPLGDVPSVEVPLWFAGLMDGAGG